MYSDTDLQDAVDARILSPEAAMAFRGYITTARAAPPSEEERFRLITGFNDIFVGIAKIILLVAVAWIGQSVHEALAGLLVAVTAWGLAEYFTRVRRMALPSIILVLAFSGGVFGAMGGLIVRHGESWFGNQPADWIPGLLLGGMAAITAVATLLHWRRFMVPITVAVGAAALAGTAIALILAGTGFDRPRETLVLALALVAGIGIFALAMWWDSSDRARQTRRSDVAFWLHLLAAPMIAHPIFALLGVTDGANISSGAAVGVLAIYIAFGLIALAIDRRAMLVSALAYVLFALTQLFREFGAVELNVALTAFVIGSALLLLSAFWQNARRQVVALLPTRVREHLPEAVLLTHQPAA
jgi:MFS family permease